MNPGPADAAIDQAVAWLLSPDAEGPLLATGDSAAVIERVQSLAACRRMTEGVPCGTCSGCRGLTPDILRVSGAEKPISIATIRFLRTQLALFPLADRRLVILEHAESLTPSAGHAVLKLLEDAPPTARFLLTATLPGRLLPTIRSRCRQLRVPPAAAATLPPIRLPLPTGIGILAAVDSVQAETAAIIGDYLLEHVRRSGPTPAARLALLRLRDYYRVAATGGNVRLATEVLLASLLPFAHS
ncbi:MAG: hypothetical protein COT71_04030 [Candidatus Andersenbacteria bacterium CG10_big_fil_rev_8_21_14_0_10_54_11]|uniref:DNA polymerase III subunit delta n=1 Tax=Candidatus Andersenbacteria bacterium CG10_big_fil_rev_8_21_14_0_10_54_11 TaxID=1974485 RepID=A0A2M6WYK8_9BACT|nr:MAG: hypothetical protein COT71_04030 [Candidatus Andersenbacteria bacterium CG10_big_fil_rev_8_21_14_0_10_54_11]